MAILKDLETGKTFQYGMEALKHCEIEVIKCEQQNPIL